ncbi:MAG: cell envelope integrity protein CreD [Betaproteobacteria bacterium HGW-Betaproteobacteria-22]|nr:MAG: cell envelope integrity protein CreD [Betaproteobacteria bacterium HGW-Betaproteobacteria-22]
MNRSFVIKVLGIFLLTMLMSWAVSYVNALILERQDRQQQTKQDIARSSAGSQTIVGPLLAVPYTEEYVEYTEEQTADGGKLKKPVTRRESSTVYYLPENLELSGGFSNEYKKLGIYKALMYQLGGNIKGDFRIPANFNISPQHKDGKIIVHPAYVSLGISDTRGINGKPGFTWNKQAFKFEQGSSIHALGNGIHATIGEIAAATGQTIPFEFKLNLRGMESFNFTPIAENNKIALQSSWQHPHFNGSFLPDAATQKITPAGFEAQWAISSLSSSNQATLNNLLYQNTAPATPDSANSGYSSAATAARSANTLESLSIGFVEPINVYSQADRATKYGLLFIGLTFAGFFIFEILKQLRIHPAQYTLVGLAMALFYLLLISLSEHIGFAWSYVAASTACVALLGYYLSHVLKSKTNGTVFAVMLTALYGALYGILASEDNALLMGSLLVFGLLALTMIVTRKVDWYQIGTAQTN